MSDVRGFFQPIGEDLKFDKENATWWTSLPPSHEDDRDELWQELIWQNDWLDLNTWEYCGPPKKQMARCPRGHEIADWLKWDPSRMWNASDEYQPISMLAAELVCDYPRGWKMAVWSSQREWQTRRKNILAYKARHFRGMTEEASRSCATFISFSIRLSGLWWCN